MGIGKQDGGTACPHAGLIETSIQTSQQVTLFTESGTPGTRVLLCYLRVLMSLT